MISMPENYMSQMTKIKAGSTPDTLFNYPEIREKSLDFGRMLALYMVDGTVHGHFRLQYMLKSFKNNTDNFEFGLYMITNDGIFRETQMHLENNIPFEFQTMVLQRVCDITPGMLITNIPNTRKIIILNHVKYTELINDYAFPNTFYYEDEKHKFDVKSHYLLIESPDYPEPIKLDFFYSLYFALRNRLSYIHLREDQYVKLKDIRFWHMSF